MEPNSLSSLEARFHKAQKALFTAAATASRESASTGVRKDERLKMASWR